MRPDTTRRLTGPERLEDRTTMDATGFIDIPSVRFIAEHARLQLHTELSAEVWTSWERHGTSGTNGILRSVGTNAGMAGNPDNPSGQDALALRFDQPITRPTTVKLWTEGIPPTNVYAWVNSAQWMIDAGPDGAIHIDASSERPIISLSILASGGGRYGIDAFEIEGDETETTPSGEGHENGRMTHEDDANETPTEDPRPAFVLPAEFNDLLTEAVVLSRNGADWREPEANEIVEKALRKGLHVNLRSAESPIVGYRTHIAGAPSITAHVYRGTALRASIPVPADGAFSYDDAVGFTDVLFTTPTVSTLDATGESIKSNSALEQVIDDPINPMSSSAYATAGAKDLQQPASWSNVRYAFTVGREGRFLLDRDPSKYTLIRAQYTQGGGSMFDVKTVRDAGRDSRGRTIIEWAGLQDGYVQKLGDNAVLIAPGTPGKIYVQMGAERGARYTFQILDASTADELTIPATMSAATVDISPLKMYGQHKTEGVFPAVTEIREGESPSFSRAGDIANMQYHVRNNALAGGPMKVDVYVGWYTGEPTRGTLQGTYQLSMTGGQTQLLSANVRAPARPDDATSERPIISAVTTFADGTKGGHAKLGHAPKSGEKRVHDHNPDGTTTMRIESQEYTEREQARIHTLTDRALNALLSSNDKRLLAARDALGTDRVIELIAKNTAAALAASDKTEREKAVDVVMEEFGKRMDEDVEDAHHDSNGVGGGPDTPASAQQLLKRAFANGGAETQEARDAAEIVAASGLTPRRMYEQVLAWSTASNDLTAALSNVRSTVTGTMLKNAFGDLWSKRGNVMAQWTIAFRVQMVTDIPASMLVGAVNKASANEAKNACLSLLQLAQYESLLQSTVEPKTPTITMAETNKVTYLTGDTHVRIRFDLAGTTSGIRNVRVYEGDTPVAIGGAAGYINVPIADLPQHGAMSTANVMSNTTYNLRIELTLQNGQQAFRDIQPIFMHPNLPGELHAQREAVNANGNDYKSITIGNYSTLLNTTDNAVQREKENWVLSVLAAHPPFHIDNGDWSVYIGSGAHDSNSFYALDINRIGNDRDQEILSPAPGTITSIGGSMGVFEGTNDEQSIYGTIVITHDSFGSHPSWKSKILHAPLYKTSEIEPSSGKPIYMFKNANGEFVTGINIWEGKRVNPKDAVAITAGRGPLFDAHGNIRKDDQGRTIISDIGFSSHIHYEPLVDEKTINATDMIFSGWHIPMSATDDRNGTATIQDWNPDLHTSTQQGMLVNNDQRLVFFRDIAITDNHANDVWLAWEGDDVTKMKRVVWKSVKYAGEPEARLRWVDLDDEKREWVIGIDGTFSFITHL